MSTKSDYTDEEWATLLRAPTVAGMAISLADPGVRQLMQRHGATLVPDSIRPFDE